MEYFITSIFTLLGSWFLIKLINKNKNKKFHRTLYKQSDMHKVLKKFFDQQIKYPGLESHSSQLTKRRERDTIKVIVVDEKAYWVSNNVFYVADAVNGNPIPESAEPLDTKQMSNKDVKKMLFILDNLNDGENNDSGSAGNERL